MAQSLEGKVTTKLFAGFLLNPEIKMLLNLSREWKQASFTKNEGRLSEAHYQGKDYLGFYLSPEKITLVQLKELETQVRTRLKSYCPGLDADEIKMYIFPQVFVA